MENYHNIQIIGNNELISSLDIFNWLNSMNMDEEMCKTITKYLIRKYLHPKYDNE